MKKVLSILVLLVAAVALVACGGETYTIAMITDTGDIDDGSFNQGTWEGIVEYATENDVTHQYYKPAGETTSDYIAAIDLAVAGGAEIIITPGFYFETPIFEAQTKYPDITFVLIDGVPHAGDYNVTIGENTLSIFFTEHESAFLAGYALVKEGYETLGFMGGIAVPAVQRFGVGFVAGAYFAAEEDGLEGFTFASDDYTYLGSFGPSAEFKTMAGSWFDRGVDAIHAAAGGAGLSVMAAAAERDNKWVVGVDSDQSWDDTVITSALKGVGVAAKEALEEYFEGTFEGGRAITLDAAIGAVGLPMDTSRFESFTSAQYTVILGLVSAGTVVVPSTSAELGAFVAALGYDAETADFEALLGKI